jgi:TATA-box binding protein (TBP) (component of TFIID and TFIIIB)
MSFSIDDEWMQYLSNQNTSSCVGGLLHKNSQPIKIKIVEEPISLDNSIVPKCDELYISTKTKVLFLNQEIDINGVFWNIPIIEYWKPASGVIKKQMKIVSKTPEEYKEIQDRLQTIPYYTENIIKQINNPEARRIKFKDERKITVGLSKKDIINSRGKVKNAFYNCFAMILRFECQGVFKEIHVKVFNTGKLEIPGILNAGLLDTVKLMILDVLQSYLPKQIEFIDNEDNDNVLINSNFNCGFFINRDKLYAILRSEKYGIETAYEPCSYPGVKCKFYFNNDIGFDEVKQNGKIILEDRNMKMSELIENKKYTEVSFMIFRTGSCLIVGNCSEKILRFIYNFIKNILEAEYINIHVESEVQVIKNKNVKLRKKTVFMTNEYYNLNCKSLV